MLEEKLHWVFKMYNKDWSNSIQLVEMVEIFSMLYLSESLDENLAIERAEKVFHMLDADNDGDVTEEEFVNGCLEDEDLVKELNRKIFRIFRIKQSKNITAQKFPLRRKEKHNKEKILKQSLRINRINKTKSIK